MRVFVTGGTGFIGTPLVRELKRRKHTVHVTKKRLRDVRGLEQELRRFSPHVIVHLAWQGIPDLGKAMSSQNLRQSLAFLERAAKVHVPKVVVPGSCWQHEKEALARDHRDFVHAKNTLEKKGRALIEKSGGTFIWTYPFFVYGPGKRSGSLIPHLINEARARRTPIPRNPDAFHDFVYIDDVVRALIALAENNVPNGSYDIGSGSLTRTGHIAVQIARAYRLPAPKLRRMRKNGLRANNRALTLSTGWKPRVSLEDGIAKTVAWFRNTTQ